LNLKLEKFTFFLHGYCLMIKTSNVCFLGFYAISQQNPMLDLLNVFLYVQTL
jgi:hypothetical protein